jgi:hypothetical protein
MALGITWKRLENLSDDELMEYANEQRKAIFAHSWNKEKFDNEIVRIVNLKNKK